jgi:general secretion pathway protein G
MKNHRFAGNSASGFTLIELIVVIAILGLLAAFLAPNVMQQFSGAQSKTAKLYIKQLGGVLDMFNLETHRYPTTQEGLNALVQCPPGLAGCNGPYLKDKSLLKDPWNNDWKYTSPGSSGRPYEIMSFGEDGKEGGEGNAKDVKSWED